MPLELPPDIASTIPPEIMSHESIGRYNSLPELMKGHVELQEYRGRSIGLPKAGEDVAKWQAETGEKLKGHGFSVSPLSEPPPQTPDAYDFKVEGVTPEQLKEDIGVNAFRKFAHEEGMSNAKANKYIEFYAKQVVPALMAKLKDGAPAEIEMIEGDDAVSKVLGERFKTEAPIRREERDKAITSLSQTIPDLKDFLEGTAPNGKAWMANKDHPAMVQLLSEVARMQAQDFGGGVNGTASVEGASAAKKEADDIIGNKENPSYAKYWKGDKDTVEKVNKLYEKAHPGEITL